MLPRSACSNKARSRGGTRGHTPRPKSHPRHWCLSGEPDRQRRWSIYIGSVGQRLVYRVAPGGAVAEQFIAPGTGGIRQCLAFWQTRTHSGCAATRWVARQAHQPCPGHCTASIWPPVSPKRSTPSLQAACAMTSPWAPRARSTRRYAGHANTSIAEGRCGARGLGRQRCLWSPAGGVLDGIAVVGGRVIVNRWSPASCLRWKSVQTARQGDQ